MTATVLLSLGLTSAQASGPSAAEAIERLRASLPITAVQGTTVAVAGRYSNGDGLSGTDLHLFPDGTYLYCEWADVGGLVAYDKGTWQLSNALVKLVSDPDVTWDLRGGRLYIMIRREGHPQEVLLMGLERDLPYLEEAIRERDDLLEHTFLFLALAREQTYELPESAILQADLMERLWTPHYFTLFPSMVTCQIAIRDHAVLEVTLGTTSPIDIDADVFSMLLLEPSPSLKGPTDHYWATFDVKTGGSFGRSPWGELRLQVRETIRTEIALSDLLWAPNVESASPDRPVEEVVPPGRYSLRFFLQGLVRGYVVESNRLDVLVDANGIMVAP